MSRRHALLLAVLVVLLALPAASAAQPAATAGAGETAAVTFKACTPVPRYPVAGGRFTSVRVHKATCPAGKSLAVAFTACRLQHGPAGRCVRRVNGYGCFEQRQNTAASPARPCAGRACCR